ncbi:MAG: glycosyltransferase family 2 protein [Flavobacteriales bacterium]|nr:glycosyltransferase family 2 protein [Flavobacteriales bacterium]
MKVSVVIPVYNAEAFVAEAVRSALDQPQVAQVVLVNDGSKDGSAARCRELCAADARVILIEHPGGVNRGASTSRNLGVASSTEEIVAFLDADDRYLPGRFSEDERIYQEHSDAEGVYSAIGAFYHDEEGRRLFEQRFSDELTTVRVRVAPEELFHGLIGASRILDFGYFSLDGLSVRRSALERMPRLMRDDLVMGEDGEFLIRLAFHARLYPGSLNKAVSLRGVHAGNRVTRDPRWDLSRLRIYEALWEWADQVRLDPVARTRLRKDLLHYRLRCASTGGQRRKTIAMVLREPSVLRRQDTALAFVSVVFGNNGAAGRLATSTVKGLFAMLWRIRGRTPPKSARATATR